MSLCVDGSWSGPILASEGGFNTFCKLFNPNGPRWAEVQQVGFPPTTIPPLPFGKGSHGRTMREWHDSARGSTAPVRLHGPLVPQTLSTL